MSDTANNTTIIFNNRKPDAYGINDIYDPDQHGPEASGKYVPTLNSLVIYPDGSLYYVAAQDPNTLKSTLKPVSYVTGTTDSNEVRIVSYGNDKFCLYQDIRTDPHKLVVDAKFLVYGNNLKEYALYKENSDGDEECISMYFDADGSFFSNRIPLVSVSEEFSAYKYPTNCHTTCDLVEGETVVLRVFNNLGNVSAELVLYVRNATWLNDLTSHTNPIVKLDMECPQTQGDRFYVYTKQDPHHLNITPYLLYADGTKEYINIDNSQCFLYGLEDFSPSYAGKTQTLILKYFLNHRENAVNATTVNARRFLICEKELIVLSNINDYSAKISIVPRWDKTHNEWKFTYFAYTDRRNGVKVVTDLCELDPKYPIDVTASGFGKEQHIAINYNLQEIFNTDHELNDCQHYWITLWDNQRYEKYTYRDASDSTDIFGVDGSITRRPILWYDAQEDLYFIPTSIFRNQQAILESFYLLAKPPYFHTETQPPTPTHYIIRDATNGSMLVSGAIPLAEYQQGFRTIIGTPALVDDTVLLEFLIRNNDASYLTLYGVPVDIKAGTFNDEDSDVIFPDQYKN